MYWSDEVLLKIPQSSCNVEEPRHYGRFLCQTATNIQHELLDGVQRLRQQLSEKVGSLDWRDPDRSLRNQLRGTQTELRASRGEPARSRVNKSDAVVGVVLTARRSKLI